MNSEIAIFIVAFLSFIGLFFAWIFNRRARFKERLMLIEKGIDIKDLNSISERKGRFPWLRIGIVLTGIGLGLLSLYLFGPTCSTCNITGGASSALPIVVVVLSAGLSMILANFIGKSVDQK